VNSDDSYDLKDIIRDFKKYTSRMLINEIKNEPESRREWLLDLFEKAARDHTKNKFYKLWQDGNHAIELYSPYFTWIKVNYIHQNPVKAGLVKEAHFWKYSSASNYMEMESVLEAVDRLIAPVARI
jgi:REP element-mobilizing transposase RayT